MGGETVKNIIPLNEVLLTFLVNILSYISMLLLIIKTFQEQRNGIHFAYNEGVEIKWGGG